MKLTKLLIGTVLVLGLVAFNGCKKKDVVTMDPNAPMQIEGVTVDLPKLQKSIDTTGNADSQSSVRAVTMAFRYRQWDKALEALDKLGSDPNLNEEQKKLLAQVVDQVKQVAAKAPAPPQ